MSNELGFIHDRDLLVVDGDPAFTIHTIAVSPQEGKILIQVFSHDTQAFRVMTLEQLTAWIDDHPGVTKGDN